MGESRRVLLGTATDLLPVECGKRRTLLGTVELENERRARAYLKLLTIPDIAKEALCATLARRLHLPVPQPFYVYIDPVKIAGLEGQYSHANHQGIAFGVEQALYPTRRILDSTALESEIAQWSGLTNSCVFDAWIGNSDRLPKNLLFEGNDSFWLIDHDEALNQYIPPDAAVGSQLFRILSSGKPEHVLYQIREACMRFAASHIDPLNWDEIKQELVLPNVMGLEQHVDKYISMLKDRKKNLRRIVTQELGIRQLPMTFSDTEEKLKSGEDR